MFYIMNCYSPDDKDKAMLTYKPDHPFRSWSSGTRFSTNPDDPIFRRPPTEPIHAEVKKGYEGVMAEFWDNPVPLMTKKLLAALHQAGVRNIDTYSAEIYDPSTDTTYDNYVAFNIIGKIAAANLDKSDFDETIQERLISMDFDSVVLDEPAISDALIFRLAESVNAIIVHEKVKQHLEASGINTLTFLKPEECAL